MDTYENNDIPQQSEITPVAEPEKQEADNSLTDAAQSVPEETCAEPQQEPPVVRTKRGGKIFKAIIVTVAALALAAASCCITAYYVRVNLAAQDKRNDQLMNQLKQQIADLQESIHDNSFTGNGNSISGSPNVGIDGGRTPAQVYAQTVKGVVRISNVATTNINGQVSESTSFGSGFIITEDGYVVTNYHVINGATSLTVTLYDGTEYAAKVIGFDDANDIAVVKIDAQGLYALTLGSSDDLIVGDQVVAIGNPLGELSYTMTTGYISAKDRSISTDGTLINMLQIDATINSGNSGGPLLNMKGEVVGIITAKYSGITASGASIEGIGFAIPTDDVAKKIHDLVEYGYITGAQLGVMVHDMDKETAEYYNLPMGVYVKSVTAGSCAHAAGVQAKDIIIALDQYEITCLNDLSAALQEFKGGETTTITVWRSGTELALEITLDAKVPSIGG